MPPIPVLVAIIVTILASSPVVVDSIDASMGGTVINPDHGVLYSLERLGERMKEGVVNLTSTITGYHPEDYYCECAEERLGELMAVRNRSRCAYLAREYCELINKSIELCKARNRTELLEFIQSRLEHHITVLEQVHELVPEEAKGAIELAMERSSKCKEVVREAIERMRKHAPMGGIGTP